MIIDRQDPHFNRMQNIKRRMFALRNGVIADVLRRAGDPHRIIFGLNLPQLVEIATLTGPDAALAEALFANDTTRESRLLAPMLMPHENFGHDDAIRWATALVCTEEADILCHRLLRHCDFAPQLGVELLDSDSPLVQYCALRLLFNLLNMRRLTPERIMEITAGRTFEPPAAALSVQLADECRFLSGDAF